MPIVSAESKSSSYTQGEDRDFPTLKTINALKKQYCNQLTVLIGEVGKSQESYRGYNQLYERKKCLFLWTETHLQRYRNTDLSVGTELVQSNELVKTSVDGYLQWGSELATSLKNVLKSVKDVKTKLSDLRDAACKLDNCLNDSCNCSQVMVLTGEKPENCKEDPPSIKRRPPECDHVAQCLDELVCMPKALAFDIDSILMSSSEVIGIQVFSNLKSLSELHKPVYDQIKTFQKHLSETVKTREGDWKKCQEDLVKAVQGATQADTETFGKRSDYQGLLEAINYLCNPDCNCVSESNCERRLINCEDLICQFCKDVQGSFCGDTSAAQSS